jgi:hypothetical protein
VFPIPKEIDELDADSRMMFLRHAAMYEDISWTMIRHTNDLHAVVTEEEMKADAFAHAMSSAVSEAARCLEHSFYTRRHREQDEEGRSERMSWFSRGEACGQNYVAYQVIRTAYEILRAEYGILEKHSEIWDRIEADPEVKKRNDYMESLFVTLHPPRSVPNSSEERE